MINRLFSAVGRTLRARCVDPGRCLGDLGGGLGPEGKDGYPALAWNKRTGAIDPAVTARWKPMDLSGKPAAEWPKPGSKLPGKIYVYVGDTDTYFLDDAVQLLQATVDSRTNPPADDSTVTGSPESRHQLPS